MWSPFRKRRQATIEVRTNRWKGSRATQAAEEHLQLKRSERLATCRRMARGFAWGAASAGMIWMGIVGIRETGPMIQRGLEIREFHIEGVHHVATQEIVDRLSLKKGIALHQVNLSYLAERLQALPWIKEATIERRPLHELRISVVERTPAAIVKVGAEHFLVDQEGVMLNRLGAHDELALPLLTGREARSALHGDVRARRTVEASIELAKVMANTVDGRVEIDLSDPAGPVVSTKGTRFQFAAHALVDQWNRFQTVKSVSRLGASDGKRHEGGEVDLRYDNRVIVRERG